MGNEYTGCMYYSISSADYAALQGYGLGSLVFMTLGDDTTRYYIKASVLNESDVDGNLVMDYNDLLDYGIEVKLEFLTKSTEPNLHL